MKIAYLDCSSGISGDMLVGALIDAGVPLEHIESELSKIPLDGYRVGKKNVKRCGIRATKFEVEIEKESPKWRKWADIGKIIKTSKLDKEIKEKGLELFKQLFDTEAKVHGGKTERIHLHELGAVDCIIDIFSVLAGLKYLGIKKICSSPVNTGTGTVKTEHGEMPVPAPAALALLKGAAVFSTDTRYELVTPTGALLISGLVTEFRGIPHMKITGYGYGAGHRDLKKMPNVLRITIGETQREENIEEVFVVEANIDDMNPQLYHHVEKILFKSGALDVFLTSVIMKKQRPGTKLTALCREDSLKDIIEKIGRASCRERV